MHEAIKNSLLTACRDTDAETEDEIEQEIQIAVQLSLQNDTDAPTDGASSSSSSRVNTGNSVSEAIRNTPMVSPPLDNTASQSGSTNQSTTAIPVVSVENKAPGTGENSSSGDRSSTTPIDNVSRPDPSRSLSSTSNNNLHQNAVQTKLNPINEDNETSSVTSSSSDEQSDSEISSEPPDNNIFPPGNNIFNDFEDEGGNTTDNAEFHEVVENSEEVGGNNIDGLEEAITYIDGQVLYSPICPPITPFESAQSSETPSSFHRNGDTPSGDLLEGKKNPTWKIFFMFP